MSLLGSIGGAWNLAARDDALELGEGGAAEEGGEWMGTVRLLTKGKGREGGGRGLVLGAVAWPGRVFPWGDVVGIREAGGRTWTGNRSEAVGAVAIGPAAGRARVRLLGRPVVISGGWKWAQKVSPRDGPS